VIGQAKQYIVVSRQPTKEMLDAAWSSALAEDARGVWKDMIEAYERVLASEGNSASGNG